MAVLESPPQDRRVRRYAGPNVLAAIPLLGFVVIAYAAFAIGGADFAAERFSITMPSGAIWTIALSDLLIAGALFVLFFEILKSTRTGGNSVVDHALSMIVFMVCLILFLVWQPAASSLFFLITLISLVDVMAGFSVTIRAARRDYTVGD
jgi:hypothetical protein